MPVNFSLPSTSPYPQLILSILLPFISQLPTPELLFSLNASCLLATPARLSAPPFPQLLLTLKSALQLLLPVIPVLPLYFSCFLTPIASQLLLVLKCSCPSTLPVPQNFCPSTFSTLSPGPATPPSPPLHLPFNSSSPQLLILYA
jgi:hypothetical protein